MKSDLAGHLKTFFFSYLRQHRGVSPLTLKSYADTFRLLLRFLAARHRSSRPFTVKDLQVKSLLAFLQYLEDKHAGRSNSPFSRNLRLAAIQSFFRYLRLFEPAFEPLARRVLNIPRKRTHKNFPEFLTRHELEAVLSQIDLDAPDGVRDLSILLFLYNTGARAQETAGAQISWFDFPNRFVTITGKGDKSRSTPLWPSTVQFLRRYLDHHRRPPAPQAAASFFINQRGGPLTRFGVRSLVKKYVHRAAIKCPSLAKRKISTHSFRHTTAVHLLKARVDLNVIKDWLGHASVKSTKRYLHTDADDKQRTLERFGPPDYVVSSLAPEEDDGPDLLLGWLKDL